MNKKTVVIKCKATLPAETGFILVPFYCDVFIADEVKTEVGN